MPEFPKICVTACANATRNPLTGAAISLLSLVAQLRNTATHPDVAGLRASIIEEIKQFEIKLKIRVSLANKCKRQGTRYALCWMKRYLIRLGDVTASGVLKAC